MHTMAVPIGFKNYFLFFNELCIYVYIFAKKSVTPEFPNGIYAYYLPLDSTSLKPVVPYIIGPSYYGTPLTTK